MKSLNFFGFFGLFFEEKRAKLKKLAAKHAPHSLFLPRQSLPFFAVAAANSLYCRKLSNL